jgi:transcriptional regulator with XRE-family HTH domain
MRDAAVECAKFGAALRTVRLRQGLSQSALSETSGLHRTHISRIERGRCEPTFETLMKLRRGLGSLADVFALTERGTDAQG